jgi:multidrug efflux pump
MSSPHTNKSFNLSEWALNHAPLTRYLMVVLMVLGITAYFQLGQDEDPPFTFRAMVVRSYWPGASAQQVAEQLTDRIERTLQEVPYADKIRSYSKPGESQVIFQLKDSSPGAQVANVWYTVRKKVSDIRGTLPQGVIGPFFNDEFGDVYGVIYAVQAPGYTPAQTKVFADAVREQLLRVPDVAKVALFGAQDEKIFIEIDQTQLAQLRLDFGQVLAQINQQNAVESAGRARSSAQASDLFDVRVDGAFTSVQALAQTPIRGASGQSFVLGDVAQVTRGYADPPNVKVRHQGESVIALGVSMAKGGDIIALGKALQAAMPAIEQTLPAGVSLVQVQDQPKTVSDSVFEFIKVLIEAVVIVLGVSFLALGLHKGGRFGWYVDVRPGLVVGITIPLVLAMTFLCMKYWGIGLHKISLGSLIIALGLLVDDAIIAVEMMVRKMEQGADKVRAATYAYEATAMPMLTGTLITAAGFLPIGMAQSSVGEYTFAIFAVTSAALLISWLVSVYFVPYLGTRLLKVKPHHVASPDVDLDTDPEEAEVFDSPFYNRFRTWVQWCVDNRWKTIAATAVLFVAGLMGMGQVQQQFFPDSSRTEILVDVWFPEGTAFDANETLTKEVERVLLAEPDAGSVSVWIGSGAPRFYLPLDLVFPQNNVSQFMLVPTSIAARERLRARLPALLAQSFPQVRARVKLLPSGPPVPYPVQFRVSGPDPLLLRNLASEVKTAMRTNANMRGVNDNWNESIKVLRLKVDQARARELGVSAQSIAQATRTLLSGSTVGQFREDDKLIDIVLRHPVQAREGLQALDNAYLPTASGRMVPLAQVATPVFDWEPGVLWREGRQYAITVQGDIVDGIQGATVTNQLLPALRAIESTWAQTGNSAYRISVAGAVEESAKGTSSIQAGVPIMLFVVFTLLMLQLQSFSRALLVFLTGPLGIAGVAGALLLFNKPFGFVALLGVIALMGMIQRNSVILIDQIEKDRAKGIPGVQAIVESTVRRLRPIALTAAAAVLAMIPLSRSVFWGPMAIAIMGGLVVATVLTLLALPAIYAAWFRVTRDTP